MYTIFSLFSVLYLGGILHTSCTQPTAGLMNWAHLIPPTSNWTYDFLTVPLHLFSNSAGNPYPSHFLQGSGPASADPSPLPSDKALTPLLLRTKQICLLSRVTLRLKAEFQPARFGPVYRCWLVPRDVLKAWLPGGFKLFAPNSKIFQEGREFLWKCHIWRLQLRTGEYAFLKHLLYTLQK